MGGSMSLESPTPIDDEDNSSKLIARRTRTFSSGSTDNLAGSSSSSSASKFVEPSEETNNETCEESTPTIKESDFFVFCGECSDLEEGKLRVRCAFCLTGAFTVSGHPQGWDDVLIPSRISGFCEEGCEGTLAQFYFKCTSHVTKGEDDAASPLPLVKRNREEVPCLACGDSKKVVLVFPCPLSHVTCIDCFKEYTLVKLNQREFIQAIKTYFFIRERVWIYVLINFNCFQDPIEGYSLGCPALCPNSLITDPHHFKLLGKYQVSILLFPLYISDFVITSLISVWPLPKVKDQRIWLIQFTYFHFE
jgi:hypothetical protein